MNIYKGIECVELDKNILRISLGSLYDGYDRTCFTKRYSPRYNEYYSCGVVELSKLLNKVRRR